MGKLPSDIQSLMIKRSDFPAGFTWGVATSSFQIEGAGQQDGRGPSIWDTFCDEPGRIADQSNGLVACDHYNRLEADLDLIASLGVTAYRFSVAWPRVQPLGHGPWNEAGFAFYERLVDGLAQRGIEAYLTLYHWDLPQALQEQGGWNNREICQHFCNYACEVVRRLGDRVHTIATHNEPWVVSILGHETGIFAPGLQDRKVAYQVGHHLLVSHGMAVRAMREMGFCKPIGIVLNQSPIYPATDAPEDVAKARLDDGIVVRWYMDPLFKGAYPADVLAWLAPMGLHPPQDVRERFLAACAAADETAARALLAQQPGLLASLQAQDLALLPEQAQRGALGSVRLMLALGWPVAVPGPWQASALNQAAFRGDAAMVALLLQHGARWSERNGYGGTALGSCLHAGCNEPVAGGDYAQVLRLLLADGAPLTEAEEDELPQAMAAVLAELRGVA